MELQVKGRPDPGLIKHICRRRKAAGLQIRKNLWKNRRPPQLEGPNRTDTWKGDKSIDDISMIFKGSTNYTDYQVNKFLLKNSW